ncbi:MAG: hypothetical protein U0930_16490 [Pirellulales bacterium]
MATDEPFNHSKKDSILPDSTKLLLVVMGQSEWSAEELIARKANPKWLLNEAEKTLMVWHRQTRPTQLAERLHKVLSEIDQELVRRRAMVVIYIAIEDRQTDPAFARAFADRCKEELELSRIAIGHYLTASKIVGVLREYHPGKTFWSYASPLVDVYDRVSTYLIDTDSRATSDLNPDKAAFDMLLVNWIDHGSISTSLVPDLLDNSETTFQAIRDLLVEQSTSVRDQLRQLILDFRAIGTPTLPTSNWGRYPGRG